MKKLFAALLALALIATFVPACFADDAAVAQGGGYSVEILSANTDVDYTGTKVIVVKMKYTNSNSASACFGDTTSVFVTQNGNKLDCDGIIFDGSSFDGLAFNLRTPVCNGGSITVAYAYPCSSTDDIEVSVNVLSSDSSRRTLGSTSTTLAITD